MADIKSVSRFMKPKVNPNLKIRAMTDPEVAMSNIRKRYQNNGKTTWRGAARYTGDMAKTMMGRAFLGKQ